MYNSASIAMGTRWELEGKGSGPESKAAPSGQQPTSTRFRDRAGNAALPRCPGGSSPCQRDGVWF